MKRTLQKRPIVAQQPALPRVSVEALESRTMLSAGHGYDAPPGLGLRVIAIYSPANSWQPHHHTGHDYGLTSGGLSTAQGPTNLTPGGSTALRLDGSGHSVITGTIFQLAPNGDSTSQEVVVSVVDDGSTGNDDSKDKTDDGDTDCPPDAKPPANPGTTGTAKPALRHPTPGGNTDNAPPSGPDGAAGNSTAPPVTSQTAPPASGPTSADAPPVAQPTIARPIPQSTDTSNAAAAVTPLAFTPTAPTFTPVPSSATPGSSPSNVPSVLSSPAPSTFSGTNVSQNVPAMHELPHILEHSFTTLAAITPPIAFLASAPVSNSVAAFEAATATVHVSDVAASGLSPDVYVISAATPSLPARIAYNFVRFDAAAFHDTARAFAAELATLNVTNTDKSHTRAWAITAGVLGVDVALLVYWHRKSKRRTQKHLQPAT